ncbi:MAG: GGDEF domain-containing protein [Acidimicrobiales bacterium]
MPPPPRAAPCWAIGPPGPTTGPSASPYRSGDGARSGGSGGEEFVMLLPGTGAAEAAALIGRVLAELEQLDHGTGNDRFRCTFSAGVSELQPGDTLTRLLARADGLLYRAKEAGRNRVEAPAGAER